MSNPKPDTDIELLKPPVPMGTPPDPYQGQQRTLGSNDKPTETQLSQADQKAIDRIKAIAGKHQTNFVAKNQTQDQNKGKSI